jgi:hypothetical protein
MAATARPRPLRAECRNAPRRHHPYGCRPPMPMRYVRRHRRLCPPRQRPGPRRGQHRHRRYATATVMPALRNRPVWGNPPKPRRRDGRNGPSSRRRDRARRRQHRQAAPHPAPAISALRITRVRTTAPSPAIRGQSHRAVLVPRCNQRICRCRPGARSAPAGPS